MRAQVGPPFLFTLTCKAGVFDWPQEGQGRLAARSPMRIRFFGQYVQASVAVLAAAEATLFAAVLVIAAMIRFRSNLTELEEHTGAIWTRAALFSAVMVVSLLALGLYSARQRARAGGVIA